VGLIDRFHAGDPRALARLASLIERGDPVGEAALDLLYELTGQAHIVGITGPPGAGKSTLINALIGAIRETGRRVGVIAVDPSSPFGGGAVLGDRIRMMERHGDDGVFVRSMASRGRFGGLAPTTAGLVHLLDAAGFPVVIVETIGAGQDGVDIGALAQTVVVLQVPGLGDDIQTIKSGLLEVGDILVVNKADRLGADEVMRSLRQMSNRERHGWSIPLVRTVARSEEGVVELRCQIDAHLDYLRASGELANRQRTAARAEVLSRLRSDLERRLTLNPTVLAGLDHAIGEVAARRLAPGGVVRDLLVRLERIE
jgi:LAO/AO transport system kinase